MPEEDFISPDFFDCDAGNLIGTNNTPLLSTFAPTALALSDLSVASMNFFISTLFKPTLSTTNSAPKTSIIALPKPKAIFPRFQKLPEPKRLTKFQQHLKGVNGRNEGVNARRSKRDRMEFDEEDGKYKPRFGYKSKKHEEENVWLKELKDGEDPLKDKFVEERKEKKLRVLENRRKELRNKVESVQKSTASQGKFDEKLSKKWREPKVKGETEKRSGNVDNVKSLLERDKNILSKILNKST